jgi:hypothetical protein
VAEDDSSNDGGTGGSGGDNNAGDQSSTDAGKTFTQADVDRIVAERVGRERAKYADYPDLKKRAAAAMTEQERAVAEAEERGKAAATAAAAERLARAEFRAAASGRVDKDTLDAYLDDADLKKFIGADGEPDTKAIAARIAKLGGGGKGTNFDGGARSSSDKPTDMNALIRRQAGLG